MCSVSRRCSSCDFICFYIIYGIVMIQRSWEAISITMPKRCSNGRHDFTVGWTQESVQNLPIHCIGQYGHSVQAHEYFKSLKKNGLMPEKYYWTHNTKKKQTENIENINKYWLNIYKGKIKSSEQLQLNLHLVIWKYLWWGEVSYNVR